MLNKGYLDSKYQPPIRAHNNFSQQKKKTEHNIVFLLLLESLFKPEYFGMALHYYVFY